MTTPLLCPHGVQSPTVCPTCRAGGQTVPLDARHWTEDADHENGRYLCACRECNSGFIGHKSRVVCRLCFGSIQLVPASERDYWKAQYEQAVSERDASRATLKQLARNLFGTPARPSTENTNG